MTMGIYSIVFNGDIVYIGKSNTIEERIAGHINLLKGGRHNNYKMQRAYDEFKDTLEWFVVEEYTGEDIYAREQYWIKEFNSVEEGLNLPYTEPRRAGFAARGQKEPILVSPEGVEYPIKGLAEFCREFPELDMGALHRIIFKPHMHRRHRGWTVKKDPKIEI